MNNPTNFRIETFDIFFDGDGGKYDKLFTINNWIVYSDSFVVCDCIIKYDTSSTEK